MNKLKTAILGCTGLVGQQFVRMLDDHPYFETVVLSASDNSAHKKYGDTVAWMVEGDVPKSVRDIIITETSPDQLLEKEIKVVFSGLPSDAAKRIERQLARKNMCVFTNASAHRYDSDVPVVIPEVNPEHLELARNQNPDGPGFVVANSNCTTTGLVLGLKPLWDFGLRSVTATTYQALSGAGLRGVSSLEILENVIPYIKNEEEKVEKETQKIFGQLSEGEVKASELDVNASCCRVPTRDGHLESVVVDLDQDVDLEEIGNAFSSYKGIPQEMDLPTAPVAPILVRNEENRPQPVLDRDAGSPERAKGMAITIGRIRKKNKKINFFLLVHNTIRGAAGTCILNAELALQHKFIKV